MGAVKVFAVAFGCLSFVAGSLWVVLWVAEHAGTFATILTAITLLSLWATIWWVIFNQA